MEKKKHPFDLQDRLINFASMIIRIVREIPSDKAGNYLGGQLLRSGTSPALNYGEAQAAESKRDFIHKMRLCLKELRETMNCLKILERVGLLTDRTILREVTELVSIFVKSIQTAEKKGNR